MRSRDIVVGSSLTDESVEVTGSALSAAFDALYTDSGTGLRAP